MVITSQVQEQGTPELILTLRTPAGFEVTADSGPQDSQNPNSHLSVCLATELLEDTHSVNIHRKGEGEASRHLVPQERPWGSYTVVEHGEGYKVKRMSVLPGKRLSLQMHYHRNEYWLVLEGTARVTVGNETFLLKPNQSTYIPVQTRHRLENPGESPLEVLEVQNGPCVAEGDIVRFEDDYTRH